MPSRSASSFSASAKAMASSSTTMGASFKIALGDGDALGLAAGQLVPAVSSRVLYPSGGTE